MLRRAGRAEGCGSAIGASSHHAPRGVPRLALRVLERGLAEVGKVDHGSTYRPDLLGKLHLAVQQDVHDGLVGQEPRRSDTLRVHVIPEAAEVAVADARRHVDVERVVQLVLEDLGAEGPQRRRAMPAQGLEHRDYEPLCFPPAAEGRGGRWAASPGS